MKNEQLLQALSDMMDQKLEPINNRLDSIDNRLDGIDNRLDKLESQVSALRAVQLEMHKKLSETHQLAQDAWGTSIENRKWLENTRKSS